MYYDTLDATRGLNARERRFVAATLPSFWKADLSSEDGFDAEFELFGGLGREMQSDGVKLLGNGVNYNPRASSLREMSPANLPVAEIDFYFTQVVPDSFRGFFGFMPAQFDNIGFSQNDFGMLFRNETIDRVYTGSESDVLGLSLLPNTRYRCILRYVSTDKGVVEVWNMDSNQLVGSGVSQVIDSGATAVNVSLNDLNAPNASTLVVRNVVAYETLGTRLEPTESDDTLVGQVRADIEGRFTIVELADSPGLVGAAIRHPAAQGNPSKGVAYAYLTADANFAPERSMTQQEMDYLATAATGDNPLPSTSAGVSVYTGDHGRTIVRIRENRNRWLGVSQKNPGVVTANPALAEFTAFKRAIAQPDSSGTAIA